MIVGIIIMIVIIIIRGRFDHAVCGEGVPKTQTIHCLCKCLSKIGPEKGYLIRTVDQFPRIERQNNSKTDHH